ncbi:MAG: DNA-binding protein [Phycisphaerae bacterium]|nr:DNA-binding protein [Phycisphaerae bacterium]
MIACHIEKTFLGRLPHDGDLLEELTKFCVEHEIHLGRVEAIGAVKKARLGYYHQDTRKYAFHEIDEPMEILNLVGNISLKDDQPFVHAHVTLANRHGQAFGGHLAPGTIIFACEAMVQSLRGPSLHRKPDEPTGLPLWEMP